MLGHVRLGDTVRVASMDWFARSVVDLAQLVTGLTDRGVRMEFVMERLTFDTGASDFVATFQLHLMGAFAQMERAISSAHSERYAFVREMLHDRCFIAPTVPPSDDRIFQLLAGSCSGFHCRVTR